MRSAHSEGTDFSIQADWHSLAPKARAVAHTGMFCWDVAKDRIQWDEVMYKIFGLVPAGALSYITFLDKLHPDDREQVHAELKTALAEHRDTVLTFRIRRPDGQERLLLGSGHVERTESGHVRMFGSATDVTGHIGSLAPDVSELRFLRTVLANTPDIVALFDREFRHLYVSPAIERITGRPASEFIGKTNEDLGMPPENCREWRAVMQEAARTGQPGRIGFSIPDQDGVLRSYESRIVPVFDADSEMVSLVSIVSDVTDHALTLIELQTKQERLAAADRFKDVFISVLAHELRNPLAPIRSALGVLRLTRQEAVVDRACMIIERQTALLVTLVDDLLDLGRVREGKFSLHLQSMDVNVALHTAIEAVEPFFREKQQALTSTIPDKPTIINGDLTRIVQVFVNLLCNASKFTAYRGQVSIQAAVQGDDLRVIVEDNGAGMTSDQIEHLFTLFHQGHRAGDRVSGLGIGLTLVRQIAEAHGGTVNATSAGLGTGSRFTVSLPLSV